MTSLRDALDKPMGIDDNARRESIYAALDEANQHDDRIARLTAERDEACAACDALSATVSEIAKQRDEAILRYERATTIRISGNYADTLATMTDEKLERYATYGATELDRQLARDEQAKRANETQFVRIPACEAHNGYLNRVVKLIWTCPTCGGPRGKINPGISFDGSLRLEVDVWHNDCGHIDKYAACRIEADTNGLNTNPMTDAQFDTLNEAEDAGRAASDDEAAQNRRPA